MNSLYLSTNILTHSAITALKKAYDECTEHAAKESIISAFKAIVLLQQSLTKLNNPDVTTESDYDQDPSEYCAAV